MPAKLYSSRLQASTSACYTLAVTKPFFMRCYAPCPQAAYWPIGSKQAVSAFEILRVIWGRLPVALCVASVSAIEMLRGCGLNLFRVSGVLQVPQTNGGAIAAAPRHTKCVCKARGGAPRPRRGLAALRHWPTAGSPQIASLVQSQSKTAVLFSSQCIHNRYHCVLLILATTGRHLPLWTHRCNPKVGCLDPPLLLPLLLCSARRPPLVRHTVSALRIPR